MTYAPSIERLTDPRCPDCGARGEDITMSLDTPDGPADTCHACGRTESLDTGDPGAFWPKRSSDLPMLPVGYCGACGRRRTWGCGHTYDQELHVMRLHAIERGEADPVTGEAFTSAQRQHWIDTGDVIDAEDTCPIEETNR